MRRGKLLAVRVEGPAVSELLRIPDASRRVVADGLCSRCCCSAGGVVRGGSRQACRVRIDVLVRMMSGLHRRCRSEAVARRALECPHLASVTVIFEVVPCMKESYTEIKSSKCIY